MNQKKLTATILCISMYQMGMVGLSPVVSNVSTAFPNASELAAQLVSTFPSLMMVAAALIASSLVRVLGRRNTAILGLSLVLISGVCGTLFSSSLWLLFCWAGCMGLGIGTFVPPVNSFMVDQYEEPARTKVAGLQTTAVNLGGVILSLGAGILAGIRWNCAFLVFTGAAACLVLALRHLPGEARRGLAEKRVRSRAPRYVWLCSLQTLIFAVAYFAFPTNVSLLLVERGIRSTTASGAATACFMLGGGICGLLFGKLSRVLKNRMPAAAFLMVAVSYLVINRCRGMGVLCLAAMLSGGSLSLIFPYFLTSLAGRVKPEAIVLSTSLIISVAPNLGSFLSPLLLTNLSAELGRTDVSFRFLLAAGLALVLAAVLLVGSARRRAASFEKNAKADHSS